MDQEEIKIKATESVITFYENKIEELKEKKKSHMLLTDNQLYMINQLITFYSKKLDELYLKLFEDL